MGIKHENPSSHSSWVGGLNLVSGADRGTGVGKEADRIDDIEFRFSPGADGWSLMQQFIGIARGEQCLLLEVESGVVLKPDEEIVRKQFACSRAIEFMRDPYAKIARAARELEDDAG